MLKDPALQVTDGTNATGLLQIVTAELELTAGTAQIHHHILGNFQR
jgi:hypothetical protein